MKFAIHVLINPQLAYLVNLGQIDFIIHYHIIVIVYRDTLMLEMERVLCVILAVPNVMALHKLIAFYVLIFKQLKDY